MDGVGQRAGGAASSIGGARFRSRVLRAQDVFVESGGMIALGGPPLGGKSLLGLRLSECLPRAIRLEAIDDLSRAAPYWLPAGPGGRAVSNPTAALLTQAKRVWTSRRPTRPPMILLIARFATAAERRRARSVARQNGMRFLFVEARSRDDRALRRIPMSFLPRDELNERLRRYDAALRAYRSVGSAEALFLPALRLGRVQTRLDDYVDRVLERWRNA